VFFLLFLDLKGLKKVAYANPTNDNLSLCCWSSKVDRFIQKNANDLTYHFFRWEIDWRELSAARSFRIPFEAREVAGHSLKSALTHRLAVDTRFEDKFVESRRRLPLKKLTKYFSERF
jgi:hypothetical protein